MINQLKILGKIWKVKRKKKLKDHGTTDHSKLIIALKKKGPIDHTKETSIHELLHALDFELRLKLKHKQIYILAVALYTVMRDNKDFIRWLIEKDK